MMKSLWKSIKNLSPIAKAHAAYMIGLAITSLIVNTPGIIILAVVLHVSLFALACKISYRLHGGGDESSNS